MVVIDAEQSVERSSISWSAPHSGCFKFNIDAAVNKSFGKAGIGGILCDDGGLIRGRFSKSIGLFDPTQAELKGTLEACVLFLSSQWASSYKLIVESDSQLSVTGSIILLPLLPLFLQLWIVVTILSHPGAGIFLSHIKKQMARLMLWPS
ncbi:hypothetical protein V6N12_068935 [Hibiscus sabdariffa]|uniref:RNase H type-1 domain-containing protein n=1 Tax=Hibiscus sabdariffa TaxID=183260 RepID=A0ABR2CAL0_9ROSI